MLDGLCQMVSVIYIVRPIWLYTPCISLTTTTIPPSPTDVPPVFSLSLSLSLFCAGALSLPPHLPPSTPLPPPSLLPPTLSVCALPSAGLLRGTVTMRRRACVGASAKETREGQEEEEGSEEEEEGAGGAGARIHIGVHAVIRSR